MTDPKCPLCGAELYLVRSYSIYVDGSPTPCVDPDDAVSDDWEILCENHHRLDSGNREMDGRSAVVGYRRALTLGGAR